MSKKKHEMFREWILVKKNKVKIYKENNKEAKKKIGRIEEKKERN